MTQKALTVQQVRRRRCFRCRTRRGYAVWHICADRNRPRVVCKVCDIALNRLVLRWARFQNWEPLLRRYARMVNAA